MIAVDKGNKIQLCMHVRDRCIPYKLKIKGWKVKGWKTNALSSQNTSAVAIVISDKTNFKATSMTIDKEKLHNN